MNDQEIFNSVATHLSKQGGPALEDDSCMYRTVQGKKCAFGHLIPDNEYRPWMEGKNAQYIFGEILTHGPIEFPVLFSLRPFRGLIEDLQVAHDIVDGEHLYYPNIRVMKRASGSIKRRLEILAKAYNLDASILNTLVFPEKGWNPVKP